VPRYELGFFLASEGRNLWFQAELADLLYGPNARRWLEVLFMNRYMHALAASGEHAYGQLSGRAPRLLLSYVGQILTQGMPAAAMPPRPAP
jgi:hypothetical protein